MPLPGRLTNHKADKSLLLPSNCSKIEIYRQYVHAKEIESKKPVSWAKFHALWSDILPHIDTMKPASDLCKTNAKLLLQSNASKGSKQKRKRACSHCHQEGHTKTKKGKITCPSLL